MSFRTRAMIFIGLLVALALISATFVSHTPKDHAPQTKETAHDVISLSEAYNLAWQVRGSKDARAARSAIRTQREQEIHENRARRIAAEKREAARAARLEARRAARAKARSAKAPARSTAAVPASSSGANWDGLAMCESSGDWHINTGNGFYGGIQFTMSTWLSYGGGKYASRADLATREQQIAIGERVLRSQGRGAWPGCTAKGAW